jgi:SpoVK/Ycf46/Vps4 family AAA+-type ATPase
MNASLATKNTPRSADIDATGVLDSRMLPDAGFDALWESIFVEEELKTRLLCQGLLNFVVRPQLLPGAIPLHGIILLVGPPGTGKTTLAKGLASRIAESVTGMGEFRFIETEPHALAGAALGKSQKAVREFLGGTVAEAAAMGPLIVLLDEVETLAADRQKLSLEANPVDVHRASDAVLAQLDHLASRHPNILFIATSNFPQAIDEAFLSRADLRVDIGLPSKEACNAILTDTIEKIAHGFPGLRRLIGDRQLRKVADVCYGLDGRQIRKAVITAMTFDKQTALNPEKLTAQNIFDAVSIAKRGKESA